MRRALHKLIVGKGQAPGHTPHSTIHRRWENVVAIWNNTYEEDAGLEKLIRLFLSLSQFLFPGMYVKHLFWRQGPLYQDLATELFVLAKTALPLVVLYEGWQFHPVVLLVLCWFMLETVLYIPTLIFASDLFATPRSYRRATILLFLNYLEVVFTFAVFYASGPHLNRGLTHWSEAVYFSFVSSSTIGFGDLFPISSLGRSMVMLQSLFHISYIVLFINVFGIRTGKGYFKSQDDR